MELVESKMEIRHSNILWMILGVLFTSVVMSIDSLLGGILKALGFSITTRLIATISFQGLILLCLVSILIWIVKDWESVKRLSIVLPLRNFKALGLIFFAIILIGRTVRFFVTQDDSQELNLLTADERFDLVDGSSYLIMASVGLRPLRDIVIFLTYFVIVFKNK